MSPEPPIQAMQSPSIRYAQDLRLLAAVSFDGSLDSGEGSDSLRRAAGDRDNHSRGHMDEAAKRCPHAAPLSPYAQSRDRRRSRSNNS